MTTSAGPVQGGPGRGLPTPTVAGGVSERMSTFATRPASDGARLGEPDAAELGVAGR